MEIPYSSLPKLCPPFQPYACFYSLICKIRSIKQKKLKTEDTQMFKFDGFRGHSELNVHGKKH